MTHTSTQIRNIALVGHASVGKTTLLEALLHVAGAINTAGTVERGSTVSDTDSQEIARGHSIDSCVAHLNHGGCHINVIDTPGYADFRGATLSALGAVETTGIVINAVNGIEHGTRRMLLHAGQRGLARVLIINKLDFERTDLAALVAALRAEFGNECLPINLPVGHGRRVLDCFTNTTGETDFSSVADAHQRLLEQIVETDEALMSRYLDGGESALTTAEIHDAFERCLREGHVLPICFVSARTGVGINELLALMSQVLPAPTEGNTPPPQRADGTQLTFSADPAAPLLATVFKIVNDPFLGKLGVFRVWQGTARRDMTLLIGDDKTPCKIAHLLQVQGRTHTEVETATCGDIVAVAKLEGLHLGAVLHDGRTGESVTLASPAFPLPMVGLALSVGTRGNEQKLSTALARLAQEDACFRVEHHKELNETVARGLSELHLKIMLERLRERYGVEVETAPPRIAYRETIAATAEGHHRHKKQTGGAGQFGEVWLRVEPLTRGTGIEFVDAVKGGVIPGQFMPAVEKGVRQAIEHGAAAGYPLQDLRVTVFDGKYHPVDSREVAFVSAGRKAFLDAVANAQPVVLEPIVNLEVIAPEHHVGDITGNLAGKHARIVGTSTQAGGEALIHAQVALAALTDYTAELKSMTGGRGRYSLDFSHYAAVSAETQRQLNAAWKPHVEED